MLFEQNGDLLKHLYTSVQVYKACMVKCWGGLHSWLSVVLVGADAALPSAAHLDEFYSSLGCSPA
eukprot:90793-Amphidinium_carterae.1